MTTHIHHQRREGGRGGAGAEWLCDMGCWRRGATRRPARCGCAEAWSLALMSVLLQARCYPPPPPPTLSLSRSLLLLFSVPPRSPLLSPLSLSILTPTPSLLRFLSFLPPKYLALPLSAACLPASLPTRVSPLLSLQPSCLALIRTPAVTPFPPLPRGWAASAARGETSWRSNC